MRHIIRLLLVVITMPIVFVVLEAGIRITSPQQVENIPYEDIYTERFSPSLNRMVKSLVPGLTRTLNGTKVHINSFGNRDYEYLREKRPYVRRIAVVGSSVAFGFKLQLEDTFAKMLERKLNSSKSEWTYEVLLFGRPGFKAKEVYAYVMDEVFSYHPDIIIYSFVQNNYEDVAPKQVFNNGDGFKDNTHMSKTTSSPSLLSVLRNYFSKIKQKETVRLIRQNSHLYLFTTNSVARLLRELSPNEKKKAQAIEPLYPDMYQFRKKINYTEEWINLIGQECKKRNVGFAIMLLPYEMQLSREGIEKWRALGIKIPDDVLSFKSHLYMKLFCDGRGIYFIDVAPKFRIAVDNGEELFLDGDYGHVNREGNAIIANVLEDFTKKNFYQ